MFANLMVSIYTFSDVIKLEIVQFAAREFTHAVIRKDVRHAPYAHRRWKCPMVFVNSAP